MALAETRGWRRSDTLSAWLDQSQVLLLGGTTLSLLGFASPWFKWGDDARWWYSGWQLWRHEALSWVAILFVGYLALLVGGYWTPRRGSGATGVLAVAALALALGTLVVVGVSLADAIDRIRTMDRVVWNLGLGLMLPGHAMMVLGALTAWGLQILNDVLFGGEIGPGRSSGEARGRG